MKGYVGLNSASSPQDRLFSCPADTWFYNTDPRLGPLFISAGLHEQQFSDYSSYTLNCGNFITNIDIYPGHRYPGHRNPGVGGERLTAIKEPSRTVLISEVAAFIPYSWHQPRWRIQSNYPFNDARCSTSFIDGRVKHLRFYWDKTLANGVESWQYDPPANYEYRWSAR
jgi:hypothetical protein